MTREQLEQLSKHELIQDRGTPYLTDLHFWLAPRAMAAATLRPRSGGWCLSRRNAICR